MHQQRRIWRRKALRHNNEGNHSRYCGKFKRIGQFLKAEKEQIDDEVFENFKFRDHRFSDVLDRKAKFLKSVQFFLLRESKMGCL